MKATWTPSPGTLVILGEDAAATRHTIVLDQLSGQSQEQVEELFQADAVARFARGNVGGECVFTAEKSHATYGAALTFFKAEYARLDEQGTLVLTEGAVTLTMAGAVLRGVERATQTGLRWGIRYTFGITTIT